MWWIITVAVVLYIIINIFVAIDFRKIRVNDNDYNVDDYMSDRMGLFLFVGAAFYFPIFIVDMVYDRRYLKELREEYNTKVNNGEIENDALKKLKEAEKAAKEEAKMAYKAAKEEADKAEQAAIRAKAAEKANK